MGPSVILIRAPNWLGDTVMALPALRALRAARPEARITIVGRWAALLAGQGFADLALTYPVARHERRRVNRALGAAGADLAIVLPHSFESALSASWWRARRRIGFDTDLRGVLLTDAMPLPSPRRHQIDEYLALVGAVGASAEDTTPSWRLAVDEDAEREVDALLAEAGAGAGARLVGLHLGAAFGASKLWPPSSFADLAGRLSRAGLVPVLLGAAGDQRIAAATAACADRPPRSLVGRDRPELLPRLLSRFSCLVSGDTGVAHLAAAIGVPTVTLFGPTDPRLTAPRAARARALSREVPCAPCFLASCPIEHPCLRGIDPDDVERAVQRAAAR
jgi:heptosyltransferase-2